MAAKPPRPMWVMAASLPPVIITSARLRLDQLEDIADRVGAEAQAVAIAEHGP